MVTITVERKDVNLVTPSRTIVTIDSKTYNEVYLVVGSRVNIVMRLP